ncbi:MAG: HAD family hydrolase [Chitinispirillaceae bacterium]|jgi:D,D-heptose 1,7-bisphosphate phosphatase|nr:HAD family hydrolase [Chitinispirillaceae bacterium]
MTRRKALFLDRDGIINEDTVYPHLPEQIRFTKQIFPLCLAAQDKGYLIIVITNQAGVAKGKFPESDVVALHQWITGRFASQGVFISRFYYCPHHSDAVVPEYRKICGCRKPKPGLVIQAIREFYIDVGSSVMIGDKPSDRIGLDGLRSVIVKSKYTGENYDIPDIAGAVNLL